MRPVLFGLRQSDLVRRRERSRVRLTPPQVAVLSQFNYINHGGSEMVVYRVTPPDVDSGVRVGDREYRGFPAGGSATPPCRLAFFALLWINLSTRRSPFTPRDSDRQRGQRQLRLPRVPDSSFARARSASTTASSARVVPPILQTRPSSRSTTRATSWRSYLAINRELRRMNNETITNPRARNGARDALARPVQAADQHGRRGRLRGPAHVCLQRQGRRSPGASRLRSSRRRPAAPVLASIAAAWSTPAGSASTATA